MTVEKLHLEKASVVTCNGYVLKTDNDGNPILPKVGDKIVRQPDQVLDPFCGRGWVGVAAKQLGRKFIGAEIDPHWHAAAIARINKTVTRRWAK